MYRILIAGCGFVGSQVAEYFCSKNQKVWGIIRTPERKNILEKIKAVPIIADLTRPETLANLPQVNFVVISVAPDARDEASYRKVYVEGVRNLLAKLKENVSPQLVVYLSSTGVYPDLKGGWADEGTEPKPDSERGKILLEAENEVLNSGLPSVIFRLAGIYGPFRNRILSVKEGKLDPDMKEAYMNLIHVDDIVAAMPVLFKSAEVGEVYLGVDDEPVLRSQFFSWIAGQVGVSAPQFSKKQISGKRLRNAKLKSLGFSFKYPNFREGYSKLLTS